MHSYCAFALAKPSDSEEPWQGIEETFKLFSRQAADCRAPPLSVNWKSISVAFTLI